MMLLSDILLNLNPQQVVGNAHIEIAAIAMDSKSIDRGALFVAMKGTKVDSHAFIDEAIENGATAILVAQLPAVLKDGVCYVQVADTHFAFGIAASAFYSFPSQSMKVVGITGTNGKTTVATLLFNLFTSLGHTCGLISTVQHHIGNKVVASTHTTPNALAIQQLMHEMKMAGCSYVFMEVSSHAIHQHRIAGIQFCGAVFTNITRDHLDYHGTFDEYIRVKKLLFDHLPKEAFAISNIDDKRGAVMLQNTAALKCTYSLLSPATFKAKIIENNLTGLVLLMDGFETHFRLIGKFNAYNLLAVFGVAINLGQDKVNVLSHLSNLLGAKGRFETYLSAKDRVLAIVDYAHTPDALLNVLTTIQQLKVDDQQVITVVGCGGNRDADKRPLMAEVAVKYSNQVILTSDNPRFENPSTILDQMEEGISVSKKKFMLRIEDRAAAIQTACLLAKPNDIILIAGKGHETYQEINGIKHPFDDAQMIVDFFKTLEK